MRTLVSRLFAGSTFALTPRLASTGLALALAVPAHAAEMAGVSAAVRGSVDLARAATPARPVASGEKIFLDDSLRSGADSGMQVLLLDETVFTLGANSEIVIDEFVYDPKTGRGKLDAEIVQGVFRFVSGKIAKERPEDVELRLPSGTIGIRGTIVAGQVEDDGSALVVLLGPGRNANTQDRPGAVRVSGAGHHVDLVQANWATRIPGPGRAPTDPFPMALPDLAQLSRSLSAGTPPPPEVVEPEQAPQPGPGAFAGAKPNLVGKAGMLTSKQGAMLAKAGIAPDVKQAASKWAGQQTAEGAQFSQKLMADVQHVAPMMQAETIVGQAPFQDNVASIAQLSAITSGTATYNRPGMTFMNGGGFDFGFVLDFGIQQASFGMQNIVSPLLAMTPGNGITLNAIATDFANGSNGKALFAIPANFVFGPVCTPCNVMVDAAVLNNGGVAHEIAAKVSVSAGPIEAMADLGHIPGSYDP